MGLGWVPCCIHLGPDVLEPDSLRVSVSQKPGKRHPFSGLGINDVRLATARATDRAGRHTTRLKVQSWGFSNRGGSGMDGSMREDGTGFRFWTEIPGARASTEAVSLTLAAGPVRDAGPTLPSRRGECSATGEVVYKLRTWSNSILCYSSNERPRYLKKSC